MKYNLTHTKVIAYLILVIGGIYAFIYKSADVLMASFTASTVAMSVKNIRTKIQN